MTELILAMLIAGGLRSAEYPSIQRHERPLSDHVVLSLSVDTPTYSIREPLHLKLNLKNLGGVPAVAYFSLGPALGWLKIYYRRPSGEFRQFEYPAGDLPLGHLRRGAMQLGSEEEHSYPLLLGFDPMAHRFVLDEPGTYAIKVVYEDIKGDPNGVLESDSLTVQVVAASHDEQDALRDYSREEIGLLLQFTPLLYPMGTTGVPAARAFLQHHPDSLYAKHIRTGLAKVLRFAIGMGNATAEERDLYERVREPELRSETVVTSP